MNRYKYIATIREYLDFCLELIALRQISLDIKCALGEKGYVPFKVQYDQFIQIFEESSLPRLKEKFGIIVTLGEAKDIMKRAKEDYRNSGGNIDIYLKSDSIAEFKLKFLDNQLDNLELLDFWVFKFSDGLIDGGSALKLLKGMDLYSENYFPDILDIVDRTREEFKDCFPECTKALYFLSYIFEELPLSTKVRFIPSKLLLVCHTLLWITENDYKYPTRLDKHIAIFTLIELIFGTIEDDKVLEYLVMYIWLSSSVVPIEFSDRKNYNFGYANFIIEYRPMDEVRDFDAEMQAVQEKNFDLKFGSTATEFDGVEGGWMSDWSFTDEAKRSLEVYRSKRKMEILELNSLSIISIFITLNYF